MVVFVGWFIRFLKMVYEFDPVIYPYKLWIVVDKNPDVLSDMFYEYKGGIIRNIKEDTDML